MKPTKLWATGSRVNVSESFCKQQHLLNMINTNYPLGPPANGELIQLELRHVYLPLRVKRTNAHCFDRSSVKHSFDGAAAALDSEPAVD